MLVNVNSKRKQNFFLHKWWKRKTFKKRNGGHPQMKWAEPLRYLPASDVLPEPIRFGITELKCVQIRTSQG